MSSEKEEREILTFQKHVEPDMRAPEEPADKQIEEWMVREDNPEAEAWELISRSR